MKPHVHAELIKQWADGAEIQFFSDGKWFTASGAPAWSENTRYRVAPKETDLEKYGLKTGDVWYCVDEGLFQRILITAQSPRKNTYTKGIDIDTGKEVKILFKEEIGCALYFRVGEVYKL